jgi:cyclohexanecarboxyl-CoA dehydrogenase
VSFQLAEFLTTTEAARLLCYDALSKKDRGEPHGKETAMAKWLGTTTAFQVIHGCLLLHGHYGYNKDVPFERRLRDVMGAEIADGTVEILKLIIAREAIGQEAVPYR